MIYLGSRRQDVEVRRCLTSSVIVILWGVINEIRADPDGTDGDANGDGVTEISEDEFVEIVNTTDSAIDISNWTISDAIGVKHLFPNTIVAPGCAIVVFWCGSLTGD